MKRFALLRRAIPSGGCANDFALLRSALFHLASTDNPVFIWPKPTTQVAERQSNATDAKGVSIQGMLTL